MAEHAISFDRGVEILRGSEAATAIYLRRAELILMSLPAPVQPLRDLEDADLVQEDDPWTECGDD